MRSSWWKLRWGGRCLFWRCGSRVSISSCLTANHLRTVFISRPFPLIFYILVLLACSLLCTNMMMMFTESGDHFMLVFFAPSTKQTDDATTTETAPQTQRPLLQDDDSSRDYDVRLRIGYYGRPVQQQRETRAHHHRAAYAGRSRASPIGRAQRCAWRLRSPQHAHALGQEHVDGDNKKRHEGRHACPAQPVLPARSSFSTRTSNGLRVFGRTSFGCDCCDWSDSQCALLRPDWESAATRHKCPRY
ncbi:hypothetical protein K438DRAFT_1853968, partial [Mycena galopus ATCC 62051]